MVVVNLRDIEVKIDMVGVCGHGDQGGRRIYQSGLRNTDGLLAHRRATSFCVET